MLGIFACDAFLFQTNGRLGLLAGRGDLSLGHADGYDGRKDRKTASDDRLPVVEKLVHSRVLYPDLKRHEPSIYDARALLALLQRQSAARGGSSTRP